LRRNASKCAERTNRRQKIDLITTASEHRIDNRPLTSAPNIARPASCDAIGQVEREIAPHARSSPAAGPFEVARHCHTACPSGPRIVARPTALPRMSAPASQPGAGDPPIARGPTGPRRAQVVATDATTETRTLRYADTGEVVTVVASASEPRWATLRDQGLAVASNLNLFPKTVVADDPVILQARATAWALGVGVGGCGLVCNGCGWVWGDAAAASLLARCEGVHETVDGAVACGSGRCATDASASPPPSPTA
jgi:hypothetical protein